MTEFEWLDDEENGQCIAHLGDTGFVEAMQIGLSSSWTPRALIEDGDGGSMILTHSTSLPLVAAKKRAEEMYGMLSKMMGLS